MSRNATNQNVYSALIETIFFDNYTEGSTEVAFHRDEIVAAANTLGIKPPKNLGDVVYSQRYRSSLPVRVLATQPEGMEWVIEGTGRACYSFKLVPLNRISPNPSLVVTKVPDATPEIIAAYALSDEQALLAKVRYNRLIDVFLGLTSYSLQSHLRTSVKGVGQIEIDEVYVAIDHQGRHYVLPVQAKGGNDKLGVVQAKQDIAFCEQKYPKLICRAIAAQFMPDDVIAMFELTLEQGMIKVVNERHYKLSLSSDITPHDLDSYQIRS